MAIEQYRELEFSASTRNGIYLNHAASSPMPARVGRAIEAGLAVYARSPEQYFMQIAMPVLTSTHKRLGALMGVQPDNVALTKNTAHGLSIVADGLALDSGDNVLVAACEYPSVIYPWYAQAWRGIETRLVPVESDDTLSIDAFASRIDSRTKVIALSWVQFATGYRADLAAFAALARAHDLVFIVDAIQGLGVLELQAEALGIDIVATGAQKWLMAPHGSGGLYISPRVLDRLHPVNAGACSVVNIAKFDPLDFSLKPNAQRYEEGTPNILGAIGLDAAIELIQEAGVPAISERVLSVTAHAAEILDRRGYRVASPRVDAQRAGILLFDHPQHPTEELYQAVRAAGVTASIRNNRLRFSPHFYNTTEELEAAVAALPA